MPPGGVGVFVAFPLYGLNFAITAMVTPEIPRLRQTGDVPEGTCQNRMG
jgi:hypothetical protein